MTRQKELQRFTDVPQKRDSRRYTVLSKPYCVATNALNADNGAMFQRKPKDRIQYEDFMSLALSELPHYQAWTALPSPFMHISFISFSGYLFPCLQGLYLPTQRKGSPILRWSIGSTIPSMLLIDAVLTIIICHACFTLRKQLEKITRDSNRLASKRITSTAIPSKLMI